MNIILYPRVYNKRGAENSHSVLGVTHEGELVNVKLRLDKVTENSPSIKEFSRDDRKAKQACTATKDNGKDKREGVLLFTRCFLDEKDYNNNETNYVAKWATVLCEDKDSNEPLIGFGRLVIPKDFEIYKSLAEKLQVALEKEEDDEIDSIKTEMAKYSSFSFPGIIYSHDKIRTFISSEIEEARKYVKQSIHETFQSGMVGGFAIRLLTKDYKVIPNSYLEVYQKYNPKTKEYITAKQTADMYFDSDHARTAFKSNEFLIDIIPLKRMNSGKFTTKHYSSKNVYPMVKSLYSTIKGNIKICKVVAKTYNFVNPQNFDETKVLLDRMHSLSEPLGHPMRLSKDGTMSLLLRGETSDSINTDTEKFYWVGNDPSRMSMTRNQRILYLLDKGHMPTSSKGRVNDTVQLIENDSYPINNDDDDDSSENIQNSSSENMKSNKMEIEEDSQIIDEIVTDSDEKDLGKDTDCEQEMDGIVNHVKQSENQVEAELSSDEELEQSEPSQDLTSPHISDEENFVDECHVDAESKSDSNNNEGINSTDVDINDVDKNKIQTLDDHIQTESTVTHVDFGSLVELEDSLSTTQSGNHEDTNPEGIVDVSPENSFVQDQEPIEVRNDSCEIVEESDSTVNSDEGVEEYGSTDYLDEQVEESDSTDYSDEGIEESDSTDNLDERVEEPNTTDNSSDEDLRLTEEEKEIELQEDIQDDYSSKFMESIEQIKKGKASDVISDEQDPADILARWTNGSVDKKDVEPKPLEVEPKEKPQQVEASGEEELTGMAAFMKGYLE
ncbi:hypothetical protein DMW10_30595 [Vibrio parahaemolyticus]|nr:hypothetical protein [Vibrio parahaemolyticus]